MCTRRVLKRTHGLSMESEKLPSNANCYAKLACASHNFRPHFCLLACLLLILFQTSIVSAESELTVTIKPGTSECFYQSAKAGEILEIEYQVLDSDFRGLNLNNEMRINFQMWSPTNKELISDYRKVDGIHRHEVKETGDHRFCFDNTFSRFGNKVIYFEVYLDSDDDDDDDQWNNMDMVFSPELIYNDTMDGIKESVNKIKEDLTKCKHIQDVLRASESRDRNLQEHNFVMVNTFSFIYIVIMVSVGFIQVIMVKSLFDEKSKIHQFLMSQWWW